MVFIYGFRKSGVHYNRSGKSCKHTVQSCIWIKTLLNTVSVCVRLHFIQDGSPFCFSAIDGGQFNQTLGWKLKSITSKKYGLKVQGWMTWLHSLWKRYVMQNRECLWQNFASLSKRLKGQIDTIYMVMCYHVSTVGLNGQTKTVDFFLQGG